MRILAIVLSLFTLTSLANPFTTYTSKHGMINTHVNCIEKGESFIWIGTNSGINRVVFQGAKPVKFSPRGTSVPVTALEDDGKVVWVGLKGKGVYMMPKDNYKFIGFRKDILGDKNITGIKKVKGGLIVYTANSKYTFDFKSKEFKVKGQKLKYGSWLSFSVGGKEIVKEKDHTLSRFNKPTLSTRPYSQKFIATSFVKHMNGVLIASPSGLVFYDPSKDDIEFGEPSIRLSGFMLNGEDTITDQLDLNWDDYVFKYQFYFTELGEKESIKLNYSLVGPEGELNDSINATEGIELKGLTHGDYTLSVSALNSKGIKATNTLTYKFSIANPLKDSIWLYLIIGSIVVVWTVIVIVFTRTKFKKDIRVLEDALLEKTNKLNQMEKGKYGLVDEDKVDI